MEELKIKRGLLSKNLIPGKVYIFIDFDYNPDQLKTLSVQHNSDLCIGFQRYNYVEAFTHKEFNQKFIVLEECTNPLKGFLDDFFGRLGEDD